MAVQPERVESEGAAGVCTDCGSPIETGESTGGDYSTCGSCYEAYVENAGHW